MKWAFENFSTVVELFIAHAALAAVPTVLGLVIALPLGVLLFDRPRGRAIAVIVASVAFTIPSLALFVTLPTLLGTQILDPANIIIALTIYSTALTLRTVMESLDSVPESVRNAATASGYPTFRRILGIDLPLAVPVLTAGLRVVAVTNVSLVSVGAVIGVGGLGQLFTSGYQRNFPDQILAGIVFILILALIFDRLLASLGWVLTPWTRAGEEPLKRHHGDSGPQIASATAQTPAAQLGSAPDSDHGPGDAQTDDAQALDQDKNEGVNHVR